PLADRLPDLLAAFVPEYVLCHGHTDRSTLRDFGLQECVCEQYTPRRAADRQGHGVQCQPVPAPEADVSVPVVGHSSDPEGQTVTRLLTDRSCSLFAEQLRPGIAARSEIQWLIVGHGRSSCKRTRQLGGCVAARFVRRSARTSEQMSDHVTLDGWVSGRPH